MPIKYELLKGGTVVYVRVTGDVTVEGVMSMLKQAKMDKNLKNPHDTLVDVRFAQNMEISEGDLATFAREAVSDSKALKLNKLAIVATRDDAFDLGNKYGEIEKGTNETVIVFFSMEVALKWLNIEENIIPQQG